METEADVRPLIDPEGQLESAFIDEFLRARGYNRRAVEALPRDEARSILSEASVYAAAKLAEVEARARFVHELHPIHE
jgi:hypothetical protein